jgi:hypothetical protein
MRCFKVLLLHLIVLFCTSNIGISGNVPGIYSFFDAIQAGEHLDLSNLAQRELFYIYLKDYAVGYAVPHEIKAALERLSDTLKANAVEPKRRWKTWQFESVDGRKMRLRPLSTWEAPFRSLWGADCSTRSRFLRALEPAHVFFAMEEKNYKRIGHMEIILSEGSLDGRPRAVLERFQSPRNLSEEDVALFLFAAHQSLQAEGYGLAALNISDYGDLGHPVSNVDALVKRISRAIDTEFLHHRIKEPFQRMRDKYPFSESPNQFVFVANEIEEKKSPVSALHPKSSLRELSLRRNFCEVPLYQPFRTLSAENIKHQIVQGVKNYDDTFMHFAPHLVELKVNDEEAEFRRIMWSHATSKRFKREKLLSFWKHLEFGGEVAHIERALENLSDENLRDMLVEAKTPQKTNSLRGFLRFCQTSTLLRFARIGGFPLPEASPDQTYEMIDHLLLACAQNVEMAQR